MNLYKTDNSLLHEICEERKNHENSFSHLAIVNLKKSWFALIESTGGGAEANADSVHKEEQALALIEQAIRLLAPDSI